MRALWSQLLHRRGRAAAVAAGILVASVSFSLLTAATTTSTAQVQGTVARNLRPAYDILVRPPGSTTPLEASKGLVRDNYLSGIFGGITLQQYAQIQKTPGVQLAAPIAMIGYVLQDVQIPIDVTNVLTHAASEVLTLTENRTTDRGLTRFPSSSIGYVYVTNDPLQDQLKPGTSFVVTPTTVIGSTEVLPNGQKFTVCPRYFNVPNLTSPFADYQAQDGYCWSRQDLNANVGPVSLPPGHVGGYMDVVFPFLVAAIDPVAEQQLVGLGNTVKSGRYLQTSDSAITIGPQPISGVTSAAQLQVPVLATTNSFVDDTDQITVNQLPASAVGLLHQGLLPDQLAAALAKETPTSVEHVTITAQEAYQQLLQKLAHSSLIDAYWTSGPTTYEQLPGAELAPLPATNPSSVWTTSLFAGTGFEAAPIDSSDLGFRQLNEQLRTNTSQQLLTLHTVGEFDPSRLPGFSALSLVPLETYYPPQVTGADAASQKALRNQPLLPNANMAGYLQQPPLILTTLKSLPAFEQDFLTANTTAPISVVRVRVGGLHGSVRQQLAQIGQVAAAIRQATGLDVDITAGSSPTTETVALPAGSYGRPALILNESWVRKAVALVILNAVDGKSLALFVLILIVCGFFLANAAFAAVRARRTEIGVLRCLGWPRRMIFMLTLGEVMLTGLVAGVVGTGLSALLIALVRLEVPWWRVGLVIPVAMLLAGLSGLVPALLAARAQPLDAVAPAVRAPRRPHPVRHIAGLALVNLRRAPARAALAAAALAVGIAALTVLLALNLAFHQGVVGSELGGFVANQVRAVDYLSASLAVILGAASVADVLYINLRERASEFAVLSAVGWRRGHVARVAIGEGVGIGIAGSFFGAVLGLAVAALILGPDLSLLAAPAVAALAAGIVVTVVAASIVAATIQRLPLAATLAED
ncbi:MAG: ABC transporter permease [Candidatus Dormiibacterota bacterium]